jgi:C1A family cysteine protease
MGNMLSYAEAEEKVVDQTVKKYIYGWKRDLPDTRDRVRDFYKHYLSNKLFLKHEKISDTTKIPHTVDLRSQCPSILNQGHLGSCTANAMSNAFRFDEMKQGNPDVFIPSRLFLYYNERAMEGHTSSDTGAAVRDGMKSMNASGMCDEKNWVYDISKFTEKPPQSCYDFAKNHKSIKYQRVLQRELQMKAALASGYPIVFGFTVYQSFEGEDVAKTGIVPMPAKDERTLGGHCVLMVGYDDDKKQFIVQNSWGEEWGDKGFCYFPYAFLTNANLASDFWTMEKVDV